jgi:uncharacterized protein (TIGR03000 family)
MIEWVLDLLWFLLWATWRFLWEYGKRHPYAAALALLAIVRSFGTTVQSGWAGVLFSFGRARKVLEPGFHPLIPVVQKVRHTPVRSVTLDLPRQRVTTGDGLVYDVHTSIVYRVEDPIRAATAIDDVKRGVANLVPLVVHELMRGQTRQTLADRAALDHELAARARQALARWGLAVEQADMSSIAPTRPTLRLTQLPARVAERARLFEEQRAAGESLAAALVAPGRAPVGRSAARYRRHRPVAPGGATEPAHVTVVLPQPARLWVNGVLVHAVGKQTFETPPLERQRRYPYTMKVELLRDGQTETDTRRVILAAGKSGTVDFTKPPENGVGTTATVDFTKPPQKEATQPGAHA